MQIAAPLLAILLGYSAVSREREQGTLRLIKSLGISSREYLLGKLGGLGVVLLLSALPVMAIAGVVATVGAGPIPWPERLIRLCVALLGYGGYVTSFLLIAVAVSARVRQSTSALTLLLGVWIVAVLLVPRIGVTVGARLAPEQTQSTFFLNVEERLARGEPGNRYRTRLEEVKSALLEAHGVDSVEALPINFSGVSLQILDEYETEGYQAEYDRLWSAYHRQQNWSRMMGLFSPTVPIRELSMLLAGTALTDHRLFAERVEAYRRDYVRYLNNDMRDHAGEKGFEYEVGREFWESVPTFVHRPRGLGATLGESALPAAGVALWVLATFGWATIAFRRRFAEA
jgi:ABC-2 type transport system permease protein